MIEVQKIGSAIDAVLRQCANVPELDIAEIGVMVREALQMHEPTADERTAIRAMVWLRLTGAPLLGGIAGTIQRANALLEVDDRPSIGAAAAIAAARAEWPDAANDEVLAGMREFIAHLQADSARMLAQAAVEQAAASAT